MAPEQLVLLTLMALKYNASSLKYKISFADVGVNIAHEIHTNLF